MIEANHKDKSLDLEGAAIEAGAQEVEPLEAAEIESGHTGARFYTDPGDLDAVNRQLTEAGWTVSLSELSFRAKSGVDLTPEARKEVEQFLGDIDDNDDVHRTRCHARPTPARYMVRIRRPSGGHARLSRA